MSKEKALMALQSILDIAAYRSGTLSGEANVEDLGKVVRAALTQQPESEPLPFEVGGHYRTQGGEWVKFVKVHNQGTRHETMADENGVHRYTNRPEDMGRVTGTAHDYSDRRNTPPTYDCPQPTPQVPKEVDADILYRQSADGTQYMHTLRWSQGWNSCRNRMISNMDKSASSIAERREWINCEERLPISDDADYAGMVWGFDSWLDEVVPCLYSEICDGVTHWMPTGLVRPEPPVSGGE